EHRADDTEEVIRRRLALYHEVTHPIVSWYGERGILVSVDAMRPAEQVGREILAALEVMRSLVDLVPEESRRPVDLTSLGAAFGDGGPAVVPQPPPGVLHAARPGDGLRSSPPTCSTTSRLWKIGSPSRRLD